MKAGKKEKEVKKSWRRNITGQPKKKTRAETKEENPIPMLSLITLQ